MWLGLRKMGLKWLPFPTLIQKWKTIENKLIRPKRVDWNLCNVFWRRNWCLCFIWRSISNPKTDMMFTKNKTKILCNWHLHFFYYGHLIVTCLVVHVNSNSNVSIDAWPFLHNSHYMSFLNCACQLMCLFFVCVQVFMWETNYLQFLCKNYLQDGSREKHEECKLYHKFSTMWLSSCIFLKRSTIFTCFECLHLETLNVNKDDLNFFLNSPSKIQIYWYQTLRKPF